MKMKLTERENAYILQTSLPDVEAGENNESVEDLSLLVSRGSYVEALKNPICQKIFSAEVKKENFEKTLLLQLENLIDGAPDEESVIEAEHVVLCIGICSLQIFVQNNFTGPMVGPDFFSCFPQYSKDFNRYGTEQESEMSKEVMNQLSEYTEGIYSLIKYPEYMLVAKTVFITFLDRLTHIDTSLWWAVRYDFVLQKIALENSGEIYDRTMVNISLLEQSGVLCPKNRELVSLFYLEASQVYLQFADIGNAREKLNRARSFLRVKAELSGALGKRTKFQNDPKAQLVVKVEYEDKPISETGVEGPRLLAADLPKDVVLNDETRLPHYKFIEEDDDKVPNLTPLEQLGVLLLDLQYRRRSRASDLILKEESKAYLNAILQYPKCWVLQYNALRLRSLLESEESRAVDRALQQFQELLESVQREEPSRFERLKLFYASDLPATWSTKEEYGELLINLGMSKSALEHFEELQLWDKVIDCYNMIGMKQRSEEIIRKLLETDDSPRLWCLLGDATGDIEHYEKAWRLSNGKSSRAQKSLGNYYFIRKKDYDQAIEHYERSIAANHIQIDVWQNLAYCALMKQNWELCAKAYKKCAIFEPDSFEYWNNLAKAYMEMKASVKAFKCLKEAVRCKCDNYKLFENLALISVSVGDFSEALYAYNRLLGLKDKESHVNVTLIRGMVGGFLDKLKENFNEHLYEEYLKFIAKLCLKSPSTPDLWYFYGELVSRKPKPTAESREMVVRHFNKCLNYTVASRFWHKDRELTLTALARFVRLERALANSVEGVPPETVLPLAMSIGMNSKRVTEMARDGLTNVATGEIVREGIEPLQDASLATKRINELIFDLKTGSIS